MDKEKTEFLTVDDVAEEFQISKDAIRKAIHENELPCRKVGNQWRFSRQGLHQWLASGNLATERARREAMRGDADIDKDDE